MKTLFKNRFVPVMTSIIILMLSSCTKLDTKLKDPNSIAIVTDGAPAPSSIGKVYEQLNGLIGGQGNWFAMEEQSSDALMGPTRGTDWDDMGVWRELHLHTWNANHAEVTNAWNTINGGLFQSTLLAEASTASAGDKAAARFIRAYFTYLSCDLFGVAQHRPATAKASEIPAVYTRAEACDFVISELNAVIPALPDYSKAVRDKANKAAARFLLAKTLLNKAVFKQASATPAGPFTFAAADMTEVINQCNLIKTENPSLQIASYYWDNFTWQSGTKSTENIFVNTTANLVWQTCMGTHYFMAPDGWNGMTTLSDFYNSFADGDVRKSDSLPGYTEMVGRNAGFLIGQIRGPNDKKIGSPIVPLKDRSGNPLIFTPDCPITGASETKGIRVNKFPLDPAEMNGGGWGSKNEFTFFRFSDVILMKAEALLRGGTDSQGETALNLANSVRTKRNATPLGDISLPILLAERGRELYNEGWRRNDLIRFGKFTSPNQTKPKESPAYTVLFPIPSTALSSNPNLVQNTGY